MTTSETVGGIKTFSDIAIFDTTTAGGPGSGIKIADFELFPFSAANDQQATIRPATLDQAMNLRVMGNGTGGANFEFFGVDYFTNPADWENFRITSGTTYTLGTAAVGTGVIRPMHLQTGVNTGQITLNIDGSVSMPGALGVTGAITGSNLSGSNTGDQTIPDSTDFVDLTSTQTAAGTKTWSSYGYHTRLYLEGGNHSITTNDGGGNWNIRIGTTASATPTCTEAGYGFHQVFSQSSATMTFNISTVSMAVSDTPVWRDQLTIGPSTVDMSYQGSVKLITKSTGVTITGDVGATTVTATGDVTGNTSSDIRLKENVEPIKDPLSKVMTLTGNSFNFIDSNVEDKQYGLIAQELEFVLPELVTNDDEGFKKIRTGGLEIEALLIEAIKELKREVDELRGKIQ